MRLKREKLALSPVFYTALQAPELTNGLGVTLATAGALQQPTAAPDASASLGMFAQSGVVKSPAGSDKLGYLKLTSFSQNAADDLHRAISDLEVRGVHCWSCVCCGTAVVVEPRGHSSSSSRATVVGLLLSSSPC